MLKHLFTARCANNLSLFSKWLDDPRMNVLRGRKRAAISKLEFVLTEWSRSYVVFALIIVIHVKFEAMLDFSSNFKYEYLSNINFYSIVMKGSNMSKTMIFSRVFIKIVIFFWTEGLSKSSYFISCYLLAM